MKYNILNGNFVALETGQEMRTIHTFQKNNINKEWSAKQQASLEEYNELCEMQKNDKYANKLYTIFKWYISNIILEQFAQQIDKTIKTLDIGCGIYRSIPPYIGDLSKRFTYVGLDPIDTNHERDYLFIHGIIEDAVSCLSNDTTFDLFLFSTSLDHFSSISEVAKTIKKIASHEAIAIFFVGLHDPIIVAEATGMVYSKNIYNNLNIFHFIIQWLFTAIARLPRLFLTLLKRSYYLKHNIPLDDKHFYYFTEDNIMTYLKYFGEIINITTIPGTNALFAACKICKN